MLFITDFTVYSKVSVISNKQFELSTVLMSFRTSSQLFGSILIYSFAFVLFECLFGTNKHKPHTFPQCSIDTGKLKKQS